MEFRLNEEQEMIRSVTADFAENEIKPFVREWDRDHIVPMDTVKKLHELGLMNIGVPAEYGGEGLDNVTKCTVVDELAQRDAGTTCTLVASSLLATDPILVGTEKMVVWTDARRCNMCILSH